LGSNELDNDAREDQKSGVRLHCQRCGISGGADLSFLWFAKTFEVKRRTASTTRQRTLWLCPACSSELGSTNRCAAFLRQLVKG
jgi:hypothetical protein